MITMPSYSWGNMYLEYMLPHHRSIFFDILINGNDVFSFLTWYKFRSRTGKWAYFTGNFMRLHVDGDIARSFQNI